MADVAIRDLVTSLVGPDDWFEIGPLREIRVHCDRRQGEQK